jgi:hypothetical protein
MPEISSKAVASKKFRGQFHYASPETTFAVTEPFANCRLGGNQFWHSGP